MRSGRGSPPGDGVGGRILVRPAADADLSELRRIERAASEMFRTLGMVDVADHDPASIETLRGYAHGGRSWVAADEGGRPVAYVLADALDGGAHIEQVSLDPAHARRGIGRLLIGTVESWARGAGLRALTLTTFERVPWNAPYYRRIGFATLDDADLGPGLREVRDAEIARGLDRWPRVAMRRPVPSEPRGRSLSPSDLRADGTFAPTEPGAQPAP
jgi:GNAT superfamily N-acetyltransferase